MAVSQLALPLDWPASARDTEFLIGAANRLAVRHLERWATWPVPVTLLTGPRKSGRSRLGRLFAAQTNGRLIDDAHARPEEELFHGWNAAVATRRPLLIVADAPPPAWAIRLPDLASRLGASPQVAIGEPDDDLIRALIERRLGQRGLAAPPRLLDWLLPRIERSYVAVERIVDALDRDALSRQGPLGLARAREALSAAGVVDVSPSRG